MRPRPHRPEPRAARRPIPHRLAVGVALLGVLSLLGAPGADRLGIVPASANDFAMASGEKLQWSPDGAGQYRPMELDPRDPTGNPWLFGEQFQDPQTTALPWRTQPASAELIERHEPRPWGEQGRRDVYRSDHYRGDREREELRRRLESPRPRPPQQVLERPRPTSPDFDQTPRPAALRRPISATGDYAMGRADDTGHPGPSARVPGQAEGNAHRPW